MKKTILIASAEPPVVRELIPELQARNYDVLSVNDLKETLPRFDSRLVDLLLLDLDVSSHHGWDLLVQISEQIASARIIALTERSDLAEAAARARLNALAEKPLHLPDLLRAIEEMLAQTPGRTRFQYIKPATANFRQKVFAKAADPTWDPAVYSRWGINE